MIPEQTRMAITTEVRINMMRKLSKKTKAKCFM